MGLFSVLSEVASRFRRPRMKAKQPQMPGASAPDAGPALCAGNADERRSIGVNPRSSAVALSAVSKSAPFVYALPWQVGRTLAAGYSSTDVPRHYAGWVYAAVRAISQGCAACDVRFSVPFDGFSHHIYEDRSQEKHSPRPSEVRYFEGIHATLSGTARFLAYRPPHVGAWVRRWSIPFALPA